MSPFPERSPGVLLSPLGERAIAYDLITETAHQLNATAGTLLAACDGEADVDAAVNAWAEDAGVDRADVAAAARHHRGRLAGPGHTGLGGGLAVASRRPRRDGMMLPLPSR